MPYKRKRVSFSYSTVKRKPTTIFSQQCEWRCRTGISLYIDCNCFSLVMRLSTHPSLFFSLFQAGFNRTRSLLLGSRNSALLFQRVSGSDTHHSYYSSGTNGRPTLWSMAFLLRHFHNTLDRISSLPCSCFWLWSISFYHLFLSKCHIIGKGDL